MSTPSLRARRVAGVRITISSPETQALAARVFGINELVEMILETVDNKTILLSCNRVCKNWQATIETSQSIRENLHYLPPKQDDDAPDSSRSKLRWDERNHLLTHIFPNLFTHNDDEMRWNTEWRLASRLLLANRKFGGQDFHTSSDLIIDASRLSFGKLQYHLVNGPALLTGGWLDADRKKGWHDAECFRLVPVVLADFHDKNPLAPGPPKRLHVWLVDASAIRDQFPNLNDLNNGRIRVKHLREHIEDNAAVYKILRECNADDPILRRGATWHNMMPYARPITSLHFVAPDLTTYAEEYQNDQVVLYDSMAIDYFKPSGLTMGELYDLAIRYVSAHATTLVWARPVKDRERGHEWNADFKLVVRHMDREYLERHIDLNMQETKLLGFFAEAKAQSHEVLDAKLEVLKGLAVEGADRPELPWEDGWAGFE